MNLIYLRGKNPKILKRCGYNTKYDSYFRTLTKYDGVEWLNSMKVLGEINKEGTYEPKFPHAITPQFQKDVARKFNLKIAMTSKYSNHPNLYYYNGQYHNSTELFK